MYCRVRPGQGRRPDAPAIARAIADEASRSVEDQAYSLRSSMMHSAMRIAQAS